MEFRDGLEPSLRRRFRTGRPCLDFTHTGDDRRLSRWELLHQPGDAARFLGIILGMEPPRVRAADMAMIRTVRSSITNLARSRAGTPDSPWGEADLSILNHAAARPPLVPRLDGDHRRILLAGNAQQACSTLARDAIELFAAPQRGRIRVCEADDCGLLFVDASRPGRRRWCSMEWCGDREKKRQAGRPVT